MSDLVQAAPMHRCTFIPTVRAFPRVLTMSSRYNLMPDGHDGPMWEFTTLCPLERTTCFIADADVTCENAVAYGMDTYRTITFPWRVDLELFCVQSFDRSNDTTFTLFCNRSW